MPLPPIGRSAVEPGEVPALPRVDCAVVVVLVVVVAGVEQAVIAQTATRAVRVRMVICFIFFEFLSELMKRTPTTR